MCTNILGTTTIPPDYNDLSNNLQRNSKVLG